MKSLFSFILLVFLTKSLFSAEKKIATKIESVIVYLNGAQVTRSGEISLPSGVTEIVFHDLTPLLKKESVAVKGLGDFTILSVNQKMNYEEGLKQDAEIEKLRKRIDELRIQLAEISEKRAALQIEENLLISNKMIAGQQNGLDVDELKAAYAFFKETIPLIKLNSLRLSEEYEKLRKEQDLAQQQLNALATPKTSTSAEVIVKVNAKNPTKAKFELTYYLTSARWFPTYDIRVNSIDKPIQMLYKANISQQSGEDWSNVAITLSTNNPNTNANKPQLIPWYLRLNTNTIQAKASNSQRYTPSSFGNVSGTVTDEYGDPLPFATVRVIGSTVGTATDLDGRYQLNLPPDATQLKVSYIGFKDVVVNINNTNMNIVMEEMQAELEEVAIRSNRVANVPQQYSVNSDGYFQIANRNLQSRSKKFKSTASVAPQVVKQESVVDMNFVIEEKYDIPSDTRTYEVRIDDLSIPAFFQYYCAPKLDTDVFLTAQITDWDRYNLLEGQASIYFEGAYVGTSIMDVRFISDTLDISLGRDRSIIVKRVKMKEFSRRKIFAAEKEDSRKWEIQIRNTKNTEINLIVEDQFPISSDKQIEVKSETPEGAKVNETTKLITWELKIPPTVSKTLSFFYSVVYPKNSVIYLD